MTSDFRSSPAVLGHSGLPALPWPKRSPAVFPMRAAWCRSADSITEIVYALGEEGRLVGRDTTSTYPEAASKMPDVGYMRALSPEGVLSINPTAIIAVEGQRPERNHRGI